MDFSQNEVSPVRRFGGLGIVVLVHIVGGYLMISGLATRLIDTIKKPVETKLVKDITPPPPPPPDPTPPPPKVAAPPPPFIPPPEVPVNVQNPIPTIATTTAIKPAVDTNPKPLPPIDAKPAPVAALPPKASIVDLNSCKPDYPRASLLAEEQGTVRVQFVIGVDAQVVNTSVVQSSGYKNLDRATVNGLSRCKFQPAYKDGHAVESSFTADYVWKLPD